MNNKIINKGVDMKMSTPQCIKDGHKLYLDAIDSVTDYMKHTGQFNIEKALKIEKLRDQLERI